MIPRTCPQDTDWRSELRQAITSPEELLQTLDLPRSRWLSGARRAAQQFPLKVPRGFMTRMIPGNPHDPLLRQVLPLAEELEMIDGFHQDPVGDAPATREPGLIQKYSGRSLMITTGACAVHCRYCFRRHFPYSQSHTGGNNLSQALSAIQSDHSLSEVILSGGDPLMLDDEQLAHVLARISQIKHIRRIRIHSRLPIVLPARITSSLVQTLSASPQDVIMVVHSNHPNEIDQPVTEALSRLYQAGVKLYNQSVLLRGVNDDRDVLAELSETLFKNHVQPYYLHQLDQVQGAAHFKIPEAMASAIVRGLQAKLPGYLVPKFIREIPGQASKILINI